MCAPRSNRGYAVRLVVVVVVGLWILITIIHVFAVVAADTVEWLAQILCAANICETILFTTQVSRTRSGAAFRVRSVRADSRPA